MVSTLARLYWDPSLRGERSRWVEEEVEEEEQAENNPTGGVTLISQRAYGLSSIVKSSVWTALLRDGTAQSRAVELRKVAAVLCCSASTQTPLIRVAWQLRSGESTKPRPKARTPRQSKARMSHSPPFSRSALGQRSAVSTAPDASVALRVGQQRLLPAQVVFELQVQDAEVHRLLQAAAQQPAARRAHAGVGQGRAAHLQSFGRGQAARRRPLGPRRRPGLRPVILREEVGQVVQVLPAEALSGEDGPELRGRPSAGAEQQVLPELAVQVQIGVSLQVPPLQRMSEDRGRVPDAFLSLCTSGVLHGRVHGGEQRRAVHVVAGRAVGVAGVAGRAESFLAPTERPPDLRHRAGGRPVEQTLPGSNPGERKKEKLERTEAAPMTPDDPRCPALTSRPR
ncbi:hypothetical protein EYF80_040489 [Liparis tanakae]|uniref:Uncharacterized protein n=1 Tax=Liparis tanakae TaxID=230148 RepID=A0A4Z2G927_9TELE|nr:hypothetical protein EYF80_040489 [Liparis tanakae]